MAKANSFPSPGERLAAALISYQMGYAGVDRVLKQYAHVKVSQWWEDKAQQLLREMVNNMPELPMPEDLPKRIQ